MKKFLVVLALFFFASGIIFANDEYVAVMMTSNRDGNITNFSFSNASFSLSPPTGKTYFPHFAAAILGNYMYEKGYEFAQFQAGIAGGINIAIFKKRK